jgi:hypothetical protein
VALTRIEIAASVGGTRSPRVVLADICEPLRVVRSYRLSAAPSVKLRGEALEPRGAIASVAGLRTERRSLSLHGVPNQA